MSMANMTAANIRTIMRTKTTVNILQHITRIVCGFLPAGRRIPGRHIIYDVCDGVKTVWQKGFKP